MSQGEVSRNDWLDFLIGRGWFPTTVKGEGHRLFLLKLDACCEWTGADKHICTFVPLNDAIDPKKPIFRSGFVLAAKQAGLEPRALWLKLRDDKPSFRMPWKVSGCPRAVLFEDLMCKVLAQSASRRLIYHCPTKAAAKHRLVVVSAAEEENPPIIEEVAAGVAPSIDALCEHHEAIARAFGHPVAARLNFNATVIVREAGEAVT